MDVSISPSAPRIVGDQRPVADALATARIDRPPLAIAVAPSLAPTSLSQEALVTRSALDIAGVEAVDGSQASPRVLKPWGVLMLPADPPPGAPRVDAEAMPRLNHIPTSATKALEDQQTSLLRVPAGPEPFVTDQID